MPIEIKPASDNSIILYLDDVPSSQSIGQCKALVEQLKSTLAEILIQATPSYQSILIQFDARITDHKQVKQKIQNLLNDTQGTIPVHTDSKIIQLPVYYDLSVGPELTRIAQLHNIAIEDVISRHCMNLYSIYAIGFAPGFAYLGHVDDELATPRLPKPRSNVVRGSVGIADHQTAVYPTDSPGGWNIIGRCPSPLFDPSSNEPLPFEVGDQVQFMPITEEAFLCLGGSLEEL